MAEQEIKEATFRAKFDDQLSRGVKAAETTVINFDQSLVKVEETVRKVGPSAAALAKRWDESAAAAAKVETATRRYDKAVADITARQKAGEVTEQQSSEYMRRAAIDRDRATAAAQRQADAMRQLYGAANQNSAAMNAQGAASRTWVTSQDAAAASGRRLNSVIQQSGYQVSDFANQMATGTPIATAFGMQAGQLLQAFGPLGSALGAVVNVGGVALGMLSKMGDASNKSAKDIHGFSDTLDLFQGRIDETGQSVDGLTGRYQALGTELQRLSKLALQSDIETLNKKLVKTVTSEWDTIRNTALSGTGDKAGAVLQELVNLGKSKDITTFLTKLQDLNGAGALKLIGDEDIRGIIETQEALRRVNALLAEMEGTATPAQKALIGLGSAATDTAQALYEMARAQGQAMGSLFGQERELDRQIAALKGGESAMKAYGEEQARTTAFDKAFKLSLAAGESLLDARTEAARIATKAAEAYRLEQQRTESLKASTKAESQAERDAKAYQKVSDELDREIAAQQRLAGIVGQSVEAQREANTLTAIAEALSKARTTAVTEEGVAIAAKVREEQRLKAVVSDAKVLESSKTQLAYAQKELSLMGQAEPYRERALRSFQIQQQAGELAKTTTAANVAEWVRLQEQIADTQALTEFQKKVEETSKAISRDISENLYDQLMDPSKATSVVDFAKSMFKRIALAAIEANIILPIVTQVVGSAPGLFGISSGATGGLFGGQTVANQNGAFGGANSLASQALSYGADKMGFSTTGILDKIGTQYLGIAPTAAAVGYVAPTVTLANGTVVAASPAVQASQIAMLSETSPAFAGGAGGVGGSGVGLGGTLSAAAPYGALGAMGGAYLANNYMGGSKVGGALSGAALGAGSMAVGTAAMGAMGMGAAASAAGVSGMAGATAALSAIPVYGWIAAAVIAAIGASLGTQRASVGPLANDNDEAVTQEEIAA